MSTRRQWYQDRPWKLVEKGKHGTTFWPRNPAKLPRFEKELPSGRCLIHDVHAGQVIDTMWYAGADLDRLEPRGRQLGDRAIKKRQVSGADCYAFDFQEIYDDSDALVSRALRLVQVFKGRELVRQIEVQPTGEEAESDDG